MIMTEQELEEMLKNPICWSNKERDKYWKKEIQKKVNALIEDIRNSTIYNTDVYWIIATIKKHFNEVQDDE